MYKIANGICYYFRKSPITLEIKRDLVSMRELIEGVKTMLNLEEDSTQVLSRVFEDNDVCRKLASSTLPKTMF